MYIQVSQYQRHTTLARIQTAPWTNNFNSIQNLKTHPNPNQPQARINRTTYKSQACLTPKNSTKLNTLGILMSPKVQ